MKKDAQKLKTPSHLKDLVLLFAIPISIAILAAGLIYIPSLFANPKYDFIYSVCDDYRCSDRHLVDSTGYVVKDAVSQSQESYYDRSSTIHYYDSSNDSTRTLTLEEARQYMVTPSSKSPDGYTLTRESSSSGFLFWGNYNEGWNLKNGAKKKNVQLTNNDSYYSQDVKFLGWVNK